MNILLDTHILLWWLDNNTQLGSSRKESIEAPSNQIFVSAVSVWEINIKKALGKLHCPDNLTEVLNQFGFIELPVLWKHAMKIAELPRHHQDPFDRMLIAQTMVEDLVIFTNDEEFKNYDLKVM